MTTLGRRFLHEYYCTALGYTGAIALIGEGQGGRPVGFIVGFVWPAGFYSQLRARRWRLAWLALPAVVRSPRLIVRAFHNMRRVDAAASHPFSTKIPAELASVGVLPDVSGKGVGRGLVMAFLDQARERGADYVYLTTDHENNERVNSFYQGLGFNLARTFTATKGRLMNEYVLELIKERSR